MVTVENAEEYVELMFDFCMHTGIQKQMEAFKGEHKNHSYINVEFLFISMLLGIRTARMSPTSN